MPNTIVWTTDLDRSLTEYRASQWSWERIAAKLGISRFSLIERSRVISDVEEHQKQDVSDDRRPLPAGSGASWDAICANTCLSGAPYDLATAL
jgi:hypothetical protein